jgi:hypothetical protein
MIITLIITLKSYLLFLVNLWSWNLLYNKLKNLFKILILLFELKFENVNINFK